ncbi:hypothetical protein HQ36_08270 [Porphyromonas gingivicanis]|uniref:Exonuclease domain-containing protein n=1 Tax=Porphyromonas gingivicanis TaxID=266762 RepID=A0A0A2G3U1_9PORP|nr:hypothetical protein [Porphyromonas gingivicanis]KGN97030.1 hypothetical protein HQ36_08270 [Porphyromonas gingivicanis]
MRFLDILMLMGVVGVLYCFSRRGRKRFVQTEETAFTPTNQIDVTSSSLFHFPKAPIGAKPYYMVIDTETVDIIPDANSVETEEAPLGGHIPSQLPSVVHLSWTLLDEQAAVIREESRMLKQDRIISKSAERIHGISNEEMQEIGEVPALVYRCFLEDLSPEVTLVGHNLDFHLSAIAQDCALHKLIVPNWKDYPLLCTMLEGEKYFKKQYGDRGLPFLNLAELYGLLYFGRRDLLMTYADKSRRDILLVIACLRFFL